MRNDLSKKDKQEQRQGRWVRLGESSEEWKQREKRNAAILEVAIPAFYAGIHGAGIQGWRRKGGMRENGREDPWSETCMKMDGRKMRVMK